MIEVTMMQFGKHELIQLFSSMPASIVLPIKVFEEQQQYLYSVKNRASIANIMS